MEGQVVSNGEFWDGKGGYRQNTDSKGDEEKYLSAVLGQIEERVPGVVEGPVSEGVTEIRCGSKGGLEEMEETQRPKINGSQDQSNEEESGFEKELPNSGTSEEGGVVRLFIDGDVEKDFQMKDFLSVADAKEFIASKRSVDPANITLRRDGKDISELKYLGRGDISVDFTGVPPECVHREERILPIIKTVDVKICNEDGCWVDLKVAVVQCGGRKEYLGGYRDKRTGNVYYHAECQTNPKYNLVKKFTREVQTYLPSKETETNTVRSRLTQTPAPGIYVTNYADRIVSPRPYVPHHTTWKTIRPVGAAITIQRAWRLYRLKKFFDNHIKGVVRELDYNKKCEQLTTLNVEKKLIRMIITESHPKCRGDFSSLLWVIDNWAVKEGERLLATKMDLSRKVGLMGVLRDEVKMLYDLEKLKIRSKAENLLKQDMAVLEGTARSRAREYPNGNVTLVDDVNIQTARMYKEMFASYKRTDTTPTERLDILNSLRTCLDNNFRPEIHILELVELIEREIDMIIMGIDNKHLAYLRKRFETGFLVILHDPETNPQAKYFRKSVVPKKKYALYRCVSCRKTYPPYKMFYELRISKFSLCKSCFQIRQNSSASSLALYTTILENLRASERKKNSRSAMSFLLQPFGTYFLVHLIWNGKCFISESDNLSELRLTRWLPNQEWSMWNTILLTEYEAAKHEMIPDPLEHYDERFVLKVRIRNLLGKFHFNSVIGIDERYKRHPTQLAQLPSDHFLCVDKTHERLIPKNSTPEFFTLTNREKVL